MANPPLKYIQLDPNATRDDLLVELTAEHGAAGPAVFLAVLCAFGSDPNETLEVSPRRLARDAGVTEQDCHAVLESWERESGGRFSIQKPNDNPSETQAKPRLILSWPAFARVHGKILTSRENGSQGGRPKSKPNRNPTVTQAEPSDNPAVTQRKPIRSEEIRGEEIKEEPPLPPVANAPTRQAEKRGLISEPNPDPEATGWKVQPNHPEVTFVLAAIRKLLGPPPDEREEGNMRRYIANLLKIHKRTAIEEAITAYPKHYSEITWFLLRAKLGNLLIGGTGPLAREPHAFVAPSPIGAPNSGNSSGAYDEIKRQEELAKANPITDEDREVFFRELRKVGDALRMPKLDGVSN